MSSEENNTSPVEAVPSPAAGKSRGGGIGWLAVLLALVAVALAAYTLLQQRVLKSDTTLVDQIGQRDARIDELQRRLEAFGALNNELRSGIGRLEQRQLENADALRRLVGALSTDNTDLAVAEIEQLLIMAAHKLTLERDVNTALAALDTADRRLAGLDLPGLLDTRAQLAADMNALRVIEAVDIAGLSLYLSDLSDRVASLPLSRAAVIETAEEEEPAQVVQDTALPAWQRLLGAVWQEFRGLFVIARTGTTAKAVLLPEESWFLRQNLRLQLETAKLAVVRRDTETLRSALQQAGGWLREYFDVSDNAVTNILETIDSMENVELSPPLPDISSSLETLRAYTRLRADGEDAAELPTP